MDAKLTKAINELTDAINQNTEQLKRSDPKNWVNNIKRQISDALEKAPGNETSS